MEAGQLYTGEHLAGANGSVTVASVTPDSRSIVVYNLDVENDHRYLVTDLKILAHNTCPTGSKISSTLISSKTSNYNTATGNLESSTDASGITTLYTYTTADSPGGSRVEISYNTYYGQGAYGDHPAYIVPSTLSGSANIGFPQNWQLGLLASTTTFNYEWRNVGGTQTLVTLPQTTYNVYDRLGNILVSYTTKTVDTGTSVWTATFNQYDTAGRAISTSQATYIDNAGTGGMMNLDYADADGTTGVITADSSYSLYNSFAPLVTSTTLYSPDGQTLISTDSYGQKTINSYNAAGNLVRTLYPDGTEVRSIYDALGRVIWQTDRYKSNTTYTISNGVITFSEDNTTAANASWTVYNSLGQVSETHRMSGVRITLSSDAIAIGSTTLPADQLLEAPQEASIAVDGINPLDPNADLTTLKSSAFANTYSYYNAQGQVFQSQSSSGLISGTIYNSDGSVLESGTVVFATSQPAYSISFPQAVNVPAGTTAYLTDYTSDAYNQTSNLPASATSVGAVSYSAVTDALNHTTETFTNAADQTVETLYADGSFTQTIHSVGDAAIAGYYTSGTALPVIPAGGSETVNIAQRKSTDPIVSTIDVYDAAGNLVDVYEPAVADAVNGGTMTRPHTHYDYDASGNETSMTDADGNTTQFIYDAIGNQIGQTLPMNQTSSNIYNQYGQLDHSFDFKGNETKYAYDSQGRVQTISYYPATNLSTADDVLTYTYTPLGQVYTINDSGTGRTDTYSYDPSGNMIEDQSVQGGLTQTVYHTYDPATGLLMRTWTADGASDESFSYDTQGRLSVVTSGSQVTTYTYDANGNLHSTTTVNGSTTTVATNTYDDLNRLTDLTNTVNGTIVSEYTYTLDSEGNRIQAVETLNGSTQTINYQYDANDRLTEEKYTVAGNVTLKIDYTYDLDGNRITETQSGIAATATGTTISSYNANNELVTVEAPNGSYTFNDYDANGSLISTATATSLTGSQTTTATYTFNDRNQLVADSVNGNSDSYSYDTSGDRISKTTNGVTTNYEFDTASPTGYDQVLAETSSSGAVQVKYVWGMQIVSETNGSTTSLYELDGHGSVRQLVNVGSHAVSDTYYYDAFGNLLSSSGSTSNVYRFAGMRVDGWSGAYDDAARYYTPQTGEFISRDGGYGSKNDPISLNKYLYANADPVNVWDPSGHDGLADLLVSMSISSGLDAIVMPAIHSVVGRAISSIAIPQSLQNALNSAETPDAVVFELPASGSVTAKVWGPFSGTGGVGLEAAVSPRTGNSALYGYWYLGVSIGAQKGLSGSLFDSGIGLFWGAANSHDYTGAAALLHFPANLLSPKLTNKLATAIVTGASALGTGAINGLSGYVGGPTNASSLVSDVPAAVNFVKGNIDKFYVDVFVWAGSIGVTLNYAPVNFGESEDNFSLSYSDTYQLNPKNSVAF